MDVLTSESNDGASKVDGVANEKKAIQRKTKIYKDKEVVLYRNEWKTETKWLKAEIVEVLSKYRYRIKLMGRGSIRECHGDQLRPFNKNIIFSEFPIHNFQRIQGKEPAEKNDVHEKEDPPVRRSERLKNKLSTPAYYESRLRPVQRKRSRSP